MTSDDKEGQLLHADRPVVPQSYIRVKQMSSDEVKVLLTEQYTPTFLATEEDRGEMKLNEPGREKTESQKSANQTSRLLFTGHHPCS